MRDDPPHVYIAEDIDALHWVLALKVIAATDGSELPAQVRERIREALRNEQWGAAVALWIGTSPCVIDVYPSFDLFTGGDVELAHEELQFRPLFRD